MDSETIAVLLLMAAAGGFLLWVELHSRRTRNKTDEPNEQPGTEPVDETPRAEAAQPQRRRKKG